MYIKKSVHKNIILNESSFANKPGYIYVRDFDEEGFRIFQAEFYRLLEAGQDVIPIICDSFGGDIYSLMGMLSLIKSSPVPIATIVSTKAFSCGSVLASAGTPGKRFISPFGTILIHEASLEAGGKMSDMGVSIDHVNHLNSTLLNLLDENCRKESGFFKNLLKESNNSDLYVNAKKAKKLGLVDHIGVPTLNVEISQSVSLTIEKDLEKKLTNPKTIDRTLSIE